MARGRRCRLSWVAVLAAIVLAGCAGDADADGDRADLLPDAQGGPAQGHPPTWSVADHWTYDLSLVQDGPVTFVVVGEDGPDWIVGTDHAEFAFFHQAFAEISTLGRVGKTDLAGSEGSTRIAFLDWPLEVGKTWRLTWDGQAFDAEVTYARDGRWTVGLSQDGVSLREYVYDEEVRWFRSMVGRDANGTEVFRATYQSHGSGYAGEYVEWAIHDRVPVDLRVADVVEQTAFDVPAGVTDVWYGLAAWCDPGGLEGDQGVYGFRVRPAQAPAAAAYETIETCPAGFDETGTWMLGAGGWTAEGFSTGGTVVGEIIPRTLIARTL